MIELLMRHLMTNKCALLKPLRLGDSDKSLTNERVTWHGVNKCVFLCAYAVIFTFGNQFSDYIMCHFCVKSLIFERINPTKKKPESIASVLRYISVSLLFSCLRWTAQPWKRR